MPRDKYRPIFLNWLRVREGQVDILLPLNCSPLLCACADEHAAETARGHDVFERLQRRRPSTWPDLIYFERGWVKLTSSSENGIRSSQVKLKSSRPTAAVLLSLCLPDSHSYRSTSQNAVGVAIRRVDNAQLHCGVVRVPSCNPHKPGADPGTHGHDCLIYLHPQTCQKLPTFFDWNDSNDLSLHAYALTFSFSGEKSLPAFDGNLLFRSSLLSLPPK